MRTTWPGRLLRTLLLASIATPAFAQTAELSQEWRFRVYLDKREVGYHDFRLYEEAEGERLLQSEARFDVKILFINAYRYRHENVETWSGDCLQKIASTTDANGKPHAVNGLSVDGSFVVETAAGSTALDDCVMSFAYWNPRFLDSTRLLNVQTGEYVDVTVTPARTEKVTVGGMEIDAAHYRLVAADKTIDLWYARDNEQWLALESPVGKGRTLRYELRSPESPTVAATHGKHRKQGS